MKFKACMPLVSLVFFVLPLLLVGAKLLSEDSPDRVGLFALQEVQDYFNPKTAESAVNITKGFLFCLLVALGANLLRLLLSMWLTDEIHWWARSDGSGNPPSRFLLYLDLVWRMAAMLMLYLAVYYVSEDSVPFEWFLLSAYLLCLVWDAVVYGLNWYPVATENNWSGKMVYRWLWLDGIGTFLTGMYILFQLAHVNILARLMTFTLLLLFYLGVALFDILYPVKIHIGEKNKNKRSWLYLDLIKRDVIVVPLDEVQTQQQP